MTGWVRFVGAGLVALLAQTPQFKSGVDVARFDVVVLDKGRHPIAGLTAADFSVTENGRPLRIVGFDAVTIPAAAAAAAAPVSPVPGIETVTNHRDTPGRLVVIVLDHTIPNEGPVVTARAVANAAIDALGPNDLAAVVLTSGLALGREQGLTGSRERLHAAVASLTMGATRGTLAGVACACGDCTTERLIALAEQLGPITDYRKMILFIGSNLAVSERSEMAGAAQCRGTVGKPWQLLQRALDRANVTVHVVDPRGLETTVPAADNTPVEPAGASALRQGNLEELSDYTGGRAILAVNQPERVIPSLFAEDRTYYVLAVDRGTTRDNDGRHAVKIAVTTRSGTVLSRSAYFDTGADTSRKRSLDPLERAIAELLPRPDIPLRMSLDPAGKPAGSVLVTLATPLSAPARADVLIRVFDEFARPVGKERARVELPPRNGDYVEWGLYIDPKPGRYEVRAAVTIGKQTGSVTGYVEVPKTRARARNDDGSKRDQSIPHVAAPDGLLARIAAEIDRYSDPSSGLVLDEDYTQRLNVNGAQTRVLKSDLLVIPDAVEGWIQFRDVIAVNGALVRDRTDRLMRLFAEPRPDARAEAKRIADEGARYNVSGSIQLTRSLNQPLAALLFLRRVNQPRSRFELVGDPVAGVQQLSFVETAEAPLIGTSGATPASGDFWIDPSSGRVLRSELRVRSHLANASASATIRVRFAYDSRMRLVLPTSMDERYHLEAPSRAEFIDAQAKYSNARQFTVTTSRVE